MNQYALDISLPVAYAPEQFIVSGSNALAHEWITRWPDWPGFALYLQGDKGAGKTHLAHIWQQKSQAVFISENSSDLPQTAAIIENVETWSDEQSLFHIYNHMKLAHIPLLITSALLPNQLAFALPDVMSRLKSLPLACIQPPDDALLAAQLTKQLSDRQLKLAPDVIDYMLPRLPRSFAGLAEIVAKLDSDSLASGRTLTIPYIRQVCGW